MRGQGIHHLEEQASLAVFIKNKVSSLQKQINTRLEDLIAMMQKHQQRWPASGKRHKCIRKKQQTAFGLPLEVAIQH